MAIYNKFNDFSEQLIRGNHDFDSHVFKLFLTNSQPVAGNTVKADIPEISAGFGYPAGGATLSITITESGGVTVLRAPEVVYTANGGAIGPFRYGVIYNDTSPGKPLVGWFDYGQSTLQDAESIAVRFNNTSPGEIFQIS